MKCDKALRESLLLYAVTCNDWGGKCTLIDKVKAALNGGITTLQFRDYNLGENDFLSEALAISRLCKDFGVPFIINDNYEVAMKCQADGIHLEYANISPKDLRKIVGDKMIIGTGVSSVEAAKEAIDSGVDYLGVGAVFGTTTKKDAKNIGCDLLKEILSFVNVPVVAIGGIRSENLLELKNSGIDGVAVVSAIFELDNLDEITQETQKLLKLAKRVVC